MKGKIKKLLAKVIHPVVTKLGYTMSESGKETSLDHYHKNNLLGRFYDIVKSTKFNPKHIVDVGANHGTWTRKALVAFPESSFTLLEPQYWMRESIADLLDTNSKISFNAVGAGSKSGTFKFTIVDRDDSCSFNYTEEEANQKGYKQIEIPVVTLNELISRNQLPIPDIIKIDAEGLDIEVLEGASDLFGKTEVFMVEAGIVNKIFSNSAIELINFMDARGYRLFEITDMNRPFNPGILWLVELVFVKKNGIIDSHKWI